MADRIDVIMKEVVRIVELRMSCRNNADELNKNCELLMEAGTEAIVKNVPKVWLFLDESMKSCFSDTFIQTTYLNLFKIPPDFVKAIENTKSKKHVNNINDYLSPANQNPRKNRFYPIIRAAESKDVKNAFLHLHNLLVKLLAMLYCCFRSLNPFVPLPELKDAMTPYINKLRELVPK